MKLLSRSEEVVLLAITHLEGNAYGVTIKDYLSETTGNEWTFGAIYVPLDKLTSKGYVIKEISDPTAERGGRSKCMYRLSEKGKNALLEIKKVNEALWNNIAEVSLK